MSTELWADPYLWPGHPQVIQDVFAKKPGNHLYTLTTTGQLVEIVGYFDDGTVRVHVIPELNLLGGFTVFGIDPDDLVPNDLPDGYEYVEHDF